MRPASHIPDAEMMIIGLGSPLSFFESATSVMYLIRFVPNGSSFARMRCEHLLVEALLVPPEHLGDIDGEGAVDVDGDLGNAVLADEQAQEVDDLLRPLERERGDDDLPPALDGRADRSREHLRRLRRSTHGSARRTCSRRSGSRSSGGVSGSLRMGHVLPAEIDGVREPDRTAPFSRISMSGVADPSTCPAS